MKILIFGAKGFIGKAVSGLAKQRGLDVFEADINIDEGKNQKKVDLFDGSSIEKALIEIKPDYIIIRYSTFNFSTTFVNHFLPASL